jgi:hypothetical protein
MPNVLSFSVDEKFRVALLLDESSDTSLSLMAKDRCTCGKGIRRLGREIFPGYEKARARDNLIAKKKRKLIFCALSSRL